MGSVVAVVGGIETALPRVPCLCIAAWSEGMVTGGQIPRLARRDVGTGARPVAGDLRGQG
jgi:hypothetical protein